MMLRTLIGKDGGRRFNSYRRAPSAFLMSEKAKQSFQLNFRFTLVTLIVGSIFRSLQWKRDLMLLAAAVMFVAGWGMLENPPRSG
jgi:hypothetical protein